MSDKKKKQETGVENVTATPSGEATVNKSSNTIKNKFRIFWRWFKEDATWLQVLLIILVIFGVFIGVSYSIPAIKNAIEQGKVSTFYKDHQITYAELEEKRKSEEQFTVFFYGENCTHCETVQSGVEEYYTDLGKDNVVYTINIEDKDYITQEQITFLHDELAVVYDTQDPDYISSEYKSFTDASSTGVPTPTIVIYRDGTPIRVVLGIDESNPVKYLSDTFYDNL